MCSPQKTPIATAFLACLLTCVPASASVHYVDAQAVGANNGSSWRDAFTTIQAGVEAAHADQGGEVWVRTGTYAGFAGQTESDSFEALDPNSVDILGEEKDLSYKSGPHYKSCHITVLYLTGAVTVIVPSVTFGSTSYYDSFAARMSALVHEHPDVLVFINHPSMV